MSHPIATRKLLAAATLFTLAAATQAAPAQERLVSTVIIIRCGPTDIILNQPLLEALLHEPACTKNLTQTFGDAFQRVESINAHMPATHGAGTFQVHMNCRISLTGKWNWERRDQATKAFTEHLRNRLDHMLYEAPLTRLSERRDRLRQQHLNSSSHLLEAQALIDLTEQQRVATDNQLQALTEQMVAAKLATATEEHVREHLMKSREKNVDLRNEMRKTIQKAVRERDALHDEINSVVSEREAAKPEASSKKLTARIHRLQGQLDQVNSGITRCTELSDDVQNMLTIILEQLPTCELTLQRARAQLTSLEKSIEELRAQQAKAEQRIAKNARHGIRIAHLQIDTQVTEKQLLEVEAQLARIRPVRYEVLNQR